MPCSVSTLSAVANSTRMSLRKLIIKAGGDGKMLRHLSLLSLRRHLPRWVKSEAGEFCLTILAAAAIAAELIARWVTW
jgi:hypothetical protein